MINAYVMSPIRRRSLKRLTYDALTTNGLVAKYGFDEGSGTAVLDQSSGTALNLAQDTSPSGVSWVSPQGIQCTGSLRLYSGLASKIITPIKASDAFTIELYFKAGSAQPSTSPTIFNIGKGPFPLSGDVSIGIRQSQYASNTLIIDSALTNSGGTAVYASEAASAGSLAGGTSSITKLYACYSNNSLKIYTGVVGGGLTERYSKAQGGTALEGGWDATTGRVNIFRDPSSTDQWTGTVYLAAVYSQDHRALLGF